MNKIWHIFFLAVFPGWGWLNLGAQTVHVTPQNNNLLSNGGFEDVEVFQNLYDGVDAGGNLRVQRGEAPVFIEGGALTSIPFACSISFVDVNGDHLPDLVVASPDGHVYWYPNIGKKGEPAFDHGRLVQTYLGPATRICVCDWNGDGKPDILFGNVDGEAHVLLNIGLGGEPRWTQSQHKPRWFHPNDPPQADFETKPVYMGKDPITIGVYSAPFFADWNKDGLPDLIMGDGTYDANCVHIWLNSGSKSSPQFKPESHFILAYGEGREQLTPCVYDWNGDGIPDLIVGDREGRLALYLGTPESIKDPRKIKEVEFTKFITVGGREKLGSLISPYVCDFNDDGIPDLIYGTTSGLVMVALGKGSKEDFELDTPVPIRGIDTEKDFKYPAGWQFGTFSGIPEVVSIEENKTIDVKEGKRAFHLTFFEKFWTWSPFGGYQEGVFSMSKGLSPIIMGKEYEISFWKKGDGMKIHYNISYSEIIPIAGADPKKGPTTRGVGHTYGDVTSEGSSWSQIRKVYRLLGTRLPHIDTTGHTNSSAAVTFTFQGPGDGWLDDVQVLEIKK